MLQKEAFSLEMGVFRIRSYQRGVCKEYNLDDR